MNRLFHAPRIAFVVVAILATLPAHASACQANTDFSALSTFIQSDPQLSEVQVLDAELVRLEGEACARHWLLEVLDDEDDLQIALVDIAAGMVRLVDPDIVEFEGEEDADEQEPIEAERMIMTGSPLNDWIEGDWSDDIMTGGGGADLFVASPGTDLILDFNPSEDLLDVSLFAEREAGWGTLPSVNAVRRATSVQSYRGQPALVISLTAGRNDWALVLAGLSDPAALSASNLLFYLNDNEPEFDIQRMPRIEFYTNDDSHVVFGGYGPGDPAPRGRLISGSEDALEELREYVFEFYEAFQEDQ